MGFLSIRTIKAGVLACSLLILAAIFFFFDSGSLLADRGQEGTLSSFSHSPSAYEQLKKERTPATLAKPEIAFNGYSLFYDHPNKTYFYSLVGNIAKGSNPAVALVNAPADFKIAFLDSPISEASTHQSTRHPFLVYNDSYYAEFFFTVTSLPLLSIESNHPDVTEPGFITRKNSAVQTTLFDNNEFVLPAQRMIKSSASIRTRGASTRHLPQKSYRLGLFYVSLGHNKRKNPVALLNMRLDKDWILYAPYIDPTKIRNIFSHNLWWEMGAANNTYGVMNGAQGKFVEVFINGSYQGIYGLTHQVDGPQLNITQTDNPKTTEYFYRKFDERPLTTHSFGNRLHRKVAGDFEIRAPKNLLTSHDKWAPLEEYIRVMAAPDAEFAQKYLDMVAIDNAIDVWLFVNLSLAHDNFRKNMSYIAKWNGSRHIMLFSPWDLDQTWGYGWKGDPYPSQPVVPAPAGLFFDSEIPAARALSLNVGDVRLRAKKRYFDLRKTALSDDNLARMLAECESAIYGSGAILRNHARWPQAASSTDMAQLRNQVMDRIAFMDTAMAALDTASVEQTAAGIVN